MTEDNPHRLLREQNDRLKAENTRLDAALERTDLGDVVQIYRDRCRALLADASRNERRWREAAEIANREREKRQRAEQAIRDTVEYLRGENTPRARAVYGRLDRYMREVERDA